MTTTRSLLLAGLLTLTSLQFGCSTLAKQAFYEARGADAEVEPITLPPAESLQGRFGQVRFRPARVDLGPLAPGLAAAYERAARETERRLNGGGETAEIDSELLYFQEKGLMGSALLLVRARVWSGGRALGDAIIKAESKAFRAGGEDSLSKACTREIADYLLGEADEDEKSDDSDPTD